MHLDIAPLARETKRLQLLKIARTIMIFFVISALLPVLAYFIGSYFQPVPEIYQSVAKVITGDGTGSAFLIASEDGLKCSNRLITAKHVVQDLKIGDEMDLIFDKMQPQLTTKAKVVWMDNGERIDETKPTTFLGDVAVLELTTPNVLPSGFTGLSIGVSKDVQLEQSVTLIGYPNGDFFITNGKIGNTETTLTEAGKDIKVDLFKLDAGAWPGNSGGPLIDDQSGQVIGILVAAMTGQFKGINFALKIDNAIDLMHSKGYDIYK